jgi:four helix bundle protein
MRDHTKLKAFSMADEVVPPVYKLTTGFPKEELFGMTAQLRKAAVSAPLNIIEGCACEGDADYLKFLQMAYGSLRELRYLLDLGKRLGLMNDRDTKSVEEKSVEAEKVLFGLMRSVRKTDK